MAYYVGGFPHVIRSDKQALEDRLYKEMSALVETRSLLAHIRKATVGKIGVLNCHPFQHGPWTFAHNGEIPGCGENDALRQAVMDAIDPRFRSYILGTTDSELIFHVFLSQLARRVGDVHHRGVSLDVVVESLRDTNRIVHDRNARHGTEPAVLNYLLTNGTLLVGVRGGKELYFSTYKSRCPERDTCYAFEAYRCERAVTDGIVKHLIITSEPVAQEPNVWLPLDEGDFVAVAHGMQFRVGKLEG